MNKPDMTLRIKRINSNDKIDYYFQDFVLKIANDMTFLDAFVIIKSTLDNTFAFRSSCGGGICGSCAVSINGESRLACETHVINYDGIIYISPCYGFPVIKDLVVDFNPLWENQKAIKPWISKLSDKIDGRGITDADVSNLRDTEKCISCGICFSSCPVLIKDTYFLGPHSIVKAYQKMSDVREDDPLCHLNAMENIWNCTTCFRCNNLCPIEIEPGKVGVYIKNKLIENDKLPPELDKALANIYESHNPYGLKNVRRKSYQKELQLCDATSEPADICLINCCSNCYDPQLWGISQDLITLFDLAGYSIGTLYQKEKCCGSEVYRIGEFELYNDISDERTELLGQINSKEIVCSSPHCFDVYKNRMKFTNIPILHWVQSFVNIINKGELHFSEQISGIVAYHDPCYLAIQNKIVDEPRIIINSIPGLKLVEMEHSRQNTLCCGGGGGNVWCDKKTDHRISPLRIEEAIKVGAEILITSCPFCYIEFNDAVKTMNLSEKIKIMDLVELTLKSVYIN